MTVCGNKLTGVCAAGKCPYVKVCSPAEWDRSEPMTNEEWIKSMSTEELAKFLEEVSGYEGICTVCDEEKCTIPDKHKCKYEDAESDGWVMWLREKHNESM